MNLESEIDTTVEHKFDQIRSTLWLMTNNCMIQTNLQYCIMNQFRGIATHQILIEL